MLSTLSTLDGKRPYLLKMSKDSSNKLQNQSDNDESEKFVKTFAMNIKMRV